MPATREYVDHFTKLAGEFMQRRDEKKYVGLLPPALSQSVLDAARAEGAKVRTWMAQADGELDRLRGELKTAQAAVRAACVPVTGQVRAVGDPLTAEYHLVHTETTARQRTKAAVALEKQTVLPLRARIAALEQAKAGGHNELSALRKICQRAAAGDIALLNFLTARWRSRLEVGGAILGKLPPAAQAMLARTTKPADAAGNELPPEALDAEGKPDLPRVGLAEARRRQLEAR